MEDLQQLGGNIELSGFSVIDPGSMIILKKIIGNYAKHFSETCNSFEKLSLTLHPADDARFSMHGEVIDNGHVYAVDHADLNVFFAADMVCKKIKHSIIN